MYDFFRKTTKIILFLIPLFIMSMVMGGNITLYNQIKHKISLTDISLACSVSVGASSIQSLVGEFSAGPGTRNNPTKAFKNWPTCSFGEEKINESNISFTLNVDMGEKLGIVKYKWKYGDPNSFFWQINPLARLKVVVDLGESKRENFSAASQIVQKLGWAAENYYIEFEKVVITVGYGNN